MPQRASLERLALSPPQTLLLEGGTEAERLDLALHWAKTANCPSALASQAKDQPAVPCLDCVICRQLQANESLDLLIFDGRIGNRQDDEKPGPIRALRMENMRELKTLTTTAPHGNGKRVAIFQGMSQTREEALNSLLKTLEEPSPHTLFVLLTPQRQQLLPTLVSRSFCLTLPWKGSLESSEALKAWEESLAAFLAGDPAFLDRVGAKGAVDAPEASQIILACQRSLVSALAGRPGGSLAKALAPLCRDARKAALLSNWLTEAQEMLTATVTPARVLEAFATRMFMLLRQ